MDTPSKNDFSSSSGSEPSSESCENHCAPSYAAKVVSKELALTSQESEILLQELMKHDEDPILVIKENPDWVYQANPANTANRRNQVLDAVATWRMQGPRRRDESATRFLFHFDYARDIHGCKTAIRAQFPEAFGISTATITTQCATSLNVNLAATPDVPPLGRAYVIHKLAIKTDDVEPCSFFFCGQED